MIATPTLREVIGDNPRFRILSPFARTGDDDFAAFAGRTQESTCLDAENVEGTEFRLIDVPALNDSGFTHFLDGSQKSKKVLSDGFFPIYVSHTSAAVLARVDREIQPPDEGLYFADFRAYAPDSSAEFLARWLPLICPIKTTEDDTEATVKEQINKAIGDQRESLEIRAAEGFLNGARSSDFLLVDGGIGRILQLDAPKANLAGVIKSHAKQYFKSRSSVEAMCVIKVGQRSNVFKREEDKVQGEMVYSFYLKLRESPSENPMFGVIRVEMAAVTESIERADVIAGWLMHERDPLSLPDFRHDRLLYPIRLVEMQLKARQPSDAAIAARIG